MRRGHSLPTIKLRSNFSMFIDSSFLSVIAEMISLEDHVRFARKHTLNEDLGVQKDAFLLIRCERGKTEIHLPGILRIWESLSN